MIIATFVVQLLISGLSYKKYKELKLNAEGTSTYIYFHEIKSFLDTYKAIAKHGLLTSGAIIFYYFLQLIYRKVEMLLFINNILVDVTILISNILMVVAILIFQITLGSMALYAFSEIKHISKKDGIGVKCYKKYTNAADLAKVKRYFKWISVLGILSFIVSLIQVFIINIYLGIIYVIIMLIIFILGMADVLQHRDYNSDDYEERRKKLNFFERHYFMNVLRLFTDEEYRRFSLERLDENISNIRLGIKEI